MNGFYIEVSNKLLDPKHCKQMSDAVWLFMWFLDKMTVIDHEKGEGKVLGGKPIKYEDIKDDLGISRRTYVRWIDVLRDSDYIKTLRTPYGTCITVLKAKKIFGRSAKNGTSKNERCAENGTSDSTNMAHLDDDHGTSNKTSHKDNTEDISVRGAKAPTNDQTPKEQAVWFFKVMKENPLPEDAREFLLALTTRTGLAKATIWTEVQSFIRYWAEMTPNGKKQRWELEKTFQVTGRLTTWFIRNHKMTMRQSNGQVRKGKGLIVATPTKI
jgi:hypothetical protein